MMIYLFLVLWVLIGLGYMWMLAAEHSSATVTLRDVVIALFCGVPLLAFLLFTAAVDCLTQFRLFSIVLWRRFEEEEE